jgi:uncharacterized repeat protein (TIGR03847 family)
MSKDLGSVEIVGAEAIGQPGQRRFRLFAMIHNISVALWMEKEQLYNLSIALDRILAQLTEGRVLRTEAQASSPTPPQVAPANFPTKPEFEFQVGQLRISYDDRRNLLILTSIPLGIVMDPGEEPQLILRDEDTLSFRFTLQQAKELASSITILVSSGRPTCPFCGTPLDGGPHACVKQNGHRELVQVLENEVEDNENE